MITELTKICPVLLLFGMFGCTGNQTGTAVQENTDGSRYFTTTLNVDREVREKNYSYGSTFIKKDMYSDLPIRQHIRFPSPEIYNRRQTSKRVYAPMGYHEVFKTDFSNTTLHEAAERNQWWYLPQGGEFGYQWNVLPPHVTKLQFQTLVHCDQPVHDYIHADIVDIGGEFGNVLRYINVQTDWVDPPKSAARNQLMVKFDGQIKKLFISFDFYVPSANRENIKNGEQWYMLYEYHKNCPYRANFRIVYKPETDKFVYSLQCMFDNPKDQRYTEWIVEDREVEEWDEWVHFDTQTETNSNGKDGMWKVWLNGEILYDQQNVIIGSPIGNVFPLKQYCGRKDMVAVDNYLTVYFDNLEISYAD